MRLIDADALLEDAAEVCEDYGDGYCEFGYSHKQIEEAPTIDAVEVVRCKDCKYHMDIDNGRQKHYMCGQVGCDDWFCADGEMREDEMG